MFFSRSIGGSVLLILLICMLVLASPLSTGHPANAQSSYTLIWGDDFNGAVGSAPDGSKWGHDTGGSGWGNNEHQDYTTRSRKAFINSDSRAQDGKGLV